MTTALGSMVAYRVTVTGVVQGVGFRPYVHRLATERDLVGTVRNVGGEVEILVQGDRRVLDGFLASLITDAPALARVEDILVAPASLEIREGFVVAPSEEVSGRRQPVSPDAALCPACADELFTPGNRRYRYPFITCTECGPRFTVIESLPYDRARTSMARFTMCPACEGEYRNPANRRHHSQTNCCPTCGPRLWFEDGTGSVTEGESGAVILAAAAMLAAGGIVALRGFGGFQLAVDATSTPAVERLRRAKHRETKPFAVMVRSVAEAREHVEVDAAEAAALSSAARPVVLLHSRAEARFATGVAPGLDTVGILLPSTPLHHLLLDAVGVPLVMTSGNSTDEPIAIGNDEARERLGGLADGLLLHDREIISRYDDSVVRLVGGEPLFLRRARGYAPLPLALPVASPVPLLAVGADLKNTFALVEGGRVYLSQHIGDLEDFPTQEHFRDTLQRFRALFQVTPEIVVRDLHPGYHSTRLAADLAPSRVIAVQHHHAHVAAVLAEHGAAGPALGVAYDGTGYGDDGLVWGGELLLADLTGYRRLAHLRYAPLPGGDLVARQPWRAALGYLSLDPRASAAFELAFLGIDPQARALAEMQIARSINAPRASSMGRLFDAASAVLGLRRHSGHEGQAAMELEALAGRLVGHPLPFPLRPGTDGVWELDPLPLLTALGAHRARGDDPAQLAADFHASVIVGTAEMVAAAADVTEVRTVVLSGGVFQNARLMALLPERLESRGLTVLRPRRLSPNDGAISYGQAAVAAAILSREETTTRGAT